MGTSRLKSRRRLDQGSKLARISIGVLATIGVIDTGSITIQKWGWISSLSCPGGAVACDKVLNSAWGTIIENNSFSIPLSLIGFLGYLSILFLAIVPFLTSLSGRQIDFKRQAWWGLFFISNSTVSYTHLRAHET